MPPDFQRLMQDATRLTRQGDLNAAVAAIQSALQFDGPEPTTARSGTAPTGLVIDVDARVIAEPAAPRSEPSSPDGAGAARTGPAAAADGPPDSFVAGRHGAAGLAGREFKLYIPPAASTGEALPLVLMLHGCTQDPDDFARGTGMNALARDRGFYVLYPAQSSKANTQRCWQWFKPTHQVRGRGEPAILAGMVRQVMSRHAIDARRVYAAGLSAGGAMAAILGQTYPDLFAAVGVHSGLAAGAARDLPTALEAMKRGAAAAPATAERRAPAFVIHGTADQTVHPANGEQVARAAAGVGGSVTTEPLPSAGHRSTVRHVWRDAAGQVRAEHWVVDGAPHAWCGGTRQGSHTDPRGPDACAAMLDFFAQHPLGFT